MFEVAYPNDDMSYESLQQLCILHRCIAEDEVSLGNDEAIIRKHLTRAVELAAKSANVKAHSIAHPLVYGWEIADAPSDNKQAIRTLRDELTWKCFEEYRNADWYLKLTERLNSLL